MLNDNGEPTAADHYIARIEKMPVRSLTSPKIQEIARRGVRDPRGLAIAEVLQLCQAVVAAAKP